MFMLHVLAPLYHRFSDLAANKYAEETKEKISTKLTDELKQKNVYLVHISISLSTIFGTTKDSPQQYSSL